MSVNPGGSAALACVQNSDFVYYPVKLTAAQTLAYSGGTSTWPKGAVDCEPQSAPYWCLFQALDSGTGSPLAFNRPVKAVFSADGGTAYVLNCGPECGGVNGSNPTAAPLSNSSVSLLPVAPLIYLVGQQSGTLPTQSALSTNCATGSGTGGCTIPVPSGASNALEDSSTLYVTGQQLMPDGLYGGFLTVVNLQNNKVVPATSAVPNPVSISDGLPGAISRMLLADDNTLWIGMPQ